MRENENGSGRAMTDGAMVLMVWAPDFVREGGWVMVVLMACSVVALALCLERALALRRGAVLPRRLLETLEEVGDREAAEALARRRRSLGSSPLATVVGEVLANVHQPRARNEQAMVVAGRSVAASMERGLAMIEIVAATAPLLGLLGTVLGMVDIFGVISIEGMAEAHSFAAGLKKALYTTVAGLSIGIPTLAVFMYYSRRAERLAAEMELAATALLNRIYRSEEPEAGGVPLRRGAEGLPSKSVIGGAGLARERTGDGT